MERKRQLHLNLFIMGCGHHEAAWRTPGAEPGSITDIGYYRRLLQTAERGKLDSLFLADTYAISPTLRYKSLQSLEPFTLLSALATTTKRIGLIGTASTTYTEPYHVARTLASLDHISRGRAAWNIVTSTNDDTARNFSQTALPDHTGRYRRADEFVQVVTELWDSWEDGAVLADKHAGTFADMRRIRAIAHEGEYYAVRGPLNMPRSPQGYPVLVQAGASDTGKEFAAKHAEVVFTAQNTMTDAQANYADLKKRMRTYGRSPEKMMVLPGFCPIIGDTEAEAREKEAALHALTQPEYGVKRLSNMFQTDMSVFSLDEPLPADRLPRLEEVNGHRGRHQLYMELALREKLTLRELILRTASSRGHFSMAGTPGQIADTMALWLRESAADGFNVLPPVLPDGLEEFVDKVVPELQARGIFRTEYTGTTLREHYGLERPAGRTAMAEAIYGH